MVPCPECLTNVEPHWDWCEACGFDPDGLRPAVGATAGASIRTVAMAGSPGAPPPPAPTPSGFTAGPTIPFTPYRPPSHAAPTVGPRPPVPATTKKSGAGRVIRLVVGTFLSVIAICILAVTLLGTNAQSPIVSPGAASWRTWTAPDGSASIDLPGEPRDRSDVMPAGEHAFAGTMVDARYDTGDFAFGFQQIRPRFTLDPQLALDGYQQSLGTLTITGIDDTPYAGMPARRFIGTESATGHPTEAIVMVNGSRIYTLLATTEGPVHAEFERFLASFHIH